MKGKAEVPAEEAPGVPEGELTDLSGKPRKGRDEDPDQAPGEGVDPLKEEPKKRD